MKAHVLIYVLIISILLIVSTILLNRGSETVGGDRDERGCLIAAGYSFNSVAGACVREFDMTPDIIRAVGIASAYVGREYALTVVSFNSYEEPNSYDITFERGVERERVTVYIRNGEASSQPLE